MRNRDPILFRQIRFLCGIGAFLVAQAATAGPATPVTLEHENEGWAFALGDSDARLTAEGLFRARYQLGWSPEDEETEWFSTDAIDFTNLELELRGSIFQSAIEPFLAVEGVAHGVELLEAGMTWNVHGSTLSLTAGRFKPSFSKEFSIKQEHLTFVDRPLTEAAIAIDRDVGTSLSGQFESISLQTSGFGFDLFVRYESGLFVGLDKTLKSSTLAADPEDVFANSPAGQEDIPLPPAPYWVGRTTIGFFPKLAILDNLGLGGKQTFIEAGFSAKQDLELNTQSPGQAYGHDLTVVVGDFTMIAEALSQFGEGDSENESGLLEYERMTHGAWLETRYLIWNRFEPAIRLVDIMTDDPSADEKNIHAHHAIFGLGIYLLDQRIKWQCDVGAGFNDWNFGQTRLEAQSVLTALF